MRDVKSCLLAIMIVIVLAGCGGATLPTGTASSGPIQITFWYGLGGVPGTVMQSVITKYNQSQKKYHVVGVFQSSYDDTLSKFNTSIVSNNLPNVVQIYDVGTQRMIDTRKIIPVQKLINRDHLQSIVDDLEPAIRSYYTIAGKLYSMPFNTSTAVMYFDKNAFRQAGLDPNKKIWTYDEVLAAAKALTKRDASGKVTRAGLAFYDNPWLFEQELAVNNALHSEPDNGRTQRATKYVFNNDTGVKWLEFQKQLLADGSAIYYGTNGSTTTPAAFISGKAAMIFDSIGGLRGYINTNEKNGNKIDIGTAYMPRESNALGRTIIGGASLWVTNQGTNDQQEGAWDFIQFAIQPQLQAYWSTNTGYIPVRLSTYTQPDMKATLTKYPQLQDATNEIREGQTNYANSGCVAGNLLAVRNAIVLATDDYLTGKVSSAQTGLDQATQQSNISIDEYNAAQQ